MSQRQYIRAQKLTPAHVMIKTTPNILCLTASVYHDCAPCYLPNKQRRESYTSETFKCRLAAIPRYAARYTQSRNLLHSTKSTEIKACSLPCSFATADVHRQIYGTRHGGMISSLLGKFELTMLVVYEIPTPRCSNATTPGE